MHTIDWCMGVNYTEGGGVVFVNRWGSLWNIGRERVCDIRLLEVMSVVEDILCDID